MLLQILASWYLALYTALILALHLFISLCSRRFKLAALPRLISIFLISIILILPFSLPYFSLIDDLRRARPLNLALALAAAPSDFLAAAPFNSLFGSLSEPFRTRPNFSEENTLFAGFVAPVLALVALSAFLIASLKTLGARPPNKKSSPPNHMVYPGPYVSRFTLSQSILLSLALILLLSLTFTFPAPYAWLARLVPATTIIRVPARWLIPALFGLAGLAAFGYAIIQKQIVMNSKLQLTPYLARFLFLACAALLLLETLAIPLPLAQVENRTSLNPVYGWLAAEARAAPLALVELPLRSAPAPEYPEVKRLYASTLGWWRLVNGYSGYTPPRQPHLAQALASFPDQAAIAALQHLPQPPSSPSSSLPLYILVHPGEAPLDRSSWESSGRWQAERNPALQPLGQFEGDYLYRFLPPDSARFTAPLASFGSDRKVRLLEATIEPSRRRPTHSTRRLTLFWQSATFLPASYTVFIHLRAADGFVRGQADGPPVSGHYPTDAWQPAEIIQDIHPLPPEIDFNQVDHLAIGLYDPTTGERLPAFGPDGQRLAEDALLIPFQ
jgi:hypothetical protein